MAAIVRPGKEGKMSEKTLQARRELSEFIESNILDHIIEAAFCYGESLGVCRTIQKRFETRPVTKFLFPMLQEF
jgi:Ca2+-binding EF-hand superfamily protein